MDQKEKQEQETWAVIMEIIALVLVTWAKYLMYQAWEQNQEISMVCIVLSCCGAFFCICGLHVMHPEDGMN